MPRFSRHDPLQECFTKKKPSSLCIDIYFISGFTPPLCEAERGMLSGAKQGVSSLEWRIARHFVPRDPVW